MKEVVTSRSPVGTAEQREGGGGSSSVTLEDLSRGTKGSLLWVEEEGGGEGRVAWISITR